ncbi:MAG TPA: carbonic anhydrase [Acetobacteraceae bacterium]|nr:carbonic anhydrase [Acetobacteraceae bacterium]
MTTAHASRSCLCHACVTPPRRAVLAAAGGALLAGAVPRRPLAQTPVSPDDALRRLMDGNRRYVAKQPASFAEDLDILRQNTVARQEPFAAVLSCADSRVPVELVFDQAIGHVFVTRVAGNVCTPEVMASLEYGATVLGTAAILVLGHEGCGAVKAAIAAKAVPGQISALYAPLRPAVERAGPDPVAAIKANAQIQADLLRTASPVLAGLIAQGRLKVVAGYYSLGDGAVALLG